MISEHFWEIENFRFFWDFSKFSKNLDIKNTPTKVAGWKACGFFLKKFQRKINAEFPGESIQNDSKAIYRSEKIAHQNSTEF